MTPTNGLLVAAPLRSSGKTTVCVGLCRSFSQRGLIVQPFKKGPDYIDPMWLSSAAGRNCRNLDFFMMGDETILRAYTTFSQGADIAVVEGNLGLYDGLDPEGADSSAGLAHLLRLPVILVVDTMGMNRSVAALVQGFTRFEPDLPIRGVILNRVASARHEAKLVDSIRRNTDVEILGAIPKAPEQMKVLERHMGLIPVKEDPTLFSKVDDIGRIIAENVDLDRIAQIAKSAAPLPKLPPCPSERKASDITIGIARDRAFTFYYPENLEALEAAGARLVPFSPLEDRRLPEVNGLYIGGGFPEVFLKELEANTALRGQIRHELENGLPALAECGGLMYLTRSIEFDGARSQMVGFLPCDVHMEKKPMGLGYMTLEPTGACSWFSAGGKVLCHEFHHSRLIGLEADTRFAWRVQRGTGIDGAHDGILRKNTLSTYAHIHSCGAPEWAEDFVTHIRKTGMATKG
ncbi:MAG: cobyrinate a,c-diamide synthase [Nitrospinota bacterium]|nr:cobyrinate a,c-diamide synthase [Nitrospinota bacterium]